MSVDAISSTSTDAICLHEDKETDAFLHRLANLVALIHVTMSQISQKDRQEVLTTEREITLFTNKQADGMKAQGSSALTTATVALIFFTASFACTHGKDQAAVQQLSQFFPKIGGLYEASKSGSVKNFEAIAMIKQTKLQDKSSKAAQPESSLKDAAAQVLQKAIDQLREAAPSRT